MVGIQRARMLFLFIRTTATLGTNNRVNETLEINIELKITSQFTNFNKHFLSFLAMMEALLRKV
jgi:hypothetical protein